MMVGLVRWLGGAWCFGMMICIWWLMVAHEGHVDVITGWFCFSLFTFFLSSFSFSVVYILASGVDLKHGQHTYFIDQRRNNCEYCV